MKRIFLLLLIMVSVNVFANADSDTYCAYLERKADADKIGMRIPDAIIRFSQQEYGNQPIALIGIQQSLSNYAKANTIDEIKAAECALYSSSQQMDNEIKFGLLKLEKASLQHQFANIGATLHEIDKVILDAKNKMKSGATTIVAVNSLEDKRKLLLTTKTNIESQLARIQLPPTVSDAPVSLGDIIDQSAKHADELEVAKNNMEKHKNWDIQIQVGEGQNLNTNNTGVFVGLNARYNIGSIWRNKALDDASDLHNKWVRGEQSESNVALQTLRSQVTKLKLAEEQHHQELDRLIKDIVAKAEIVSSSDSDSAVGFNQTIGIEKLIIGMDMDNTEFNIDQYTTFLGIDK